MPTADGKQLEVKKVIDAEKTVNPITVSFYDKNKADKLSTENVENEARAEVSNIIMTALPTSIADFVLPNVADKKWLNDCVEGNNTFPSHNTKAFFFMALICGKTNLACALPTLIEYANAAKDKVAYNFEYVLTAKQYQLL